MIPRRFIQEWTQHVPWQEPRQIEQDLLITTALVKIYATNPLRSQIAFRGGTALNKIFFAKPLRYSEDIDLVQVSPGPIGDTLNLLQEVLDPFFETEPKRDFSTSCATLSYRVTSDDGFPLKIKVEINSREHFSILGFVDHAFSCTSSWNGGKAIIRTYAIEEILATKLRALYQRRKGRDLFDLYIALTTIPNLAVEKIIFCFEQYMRAEGNIITKKLLIENLNTKLTHNAFLHDMVPLLAQSQEPFNPHQAFDVLMDALIIPHMR